MGENEMVNEKNGMRKSVTKQKEKSHRKQKYIFRISGVWIELRSVCVCVPFFPLVSIRIESALSPLCALCRYVRSNKATNKSSNKYNGEVKKIP